MTIKKLLVLISSDKRKQFLNVQTRFLQLFLIF